ncbi:MAG: DUF2779 domain-containing protein [Bacilli bacterium]|nr:DUF2779 domain-containing protein [Bacilli bacterium]
MLITKTHYVEYCACPRAFWFYLHHPSEAKEVDEQAKKRIDEGMLVGRFAHQFFPDTYKVKGNEKNVDIKLQLEITQKLLKEGVNAIAEASFSVDDLFCAVDILKKEDDGYAIYEVKACNDINNHIREYYPDVAFQKYVLTRCGLNIKHCYIIHLNPDYVRHGEIDLHQLLITYSLNHNEAFDEEVKLVAANLDDLRRVINSSDVSYGKHCVSSCDFLDYCHHDLEKPNVIYINGLAKKKAHEYIEKDNIITFLDLRKAGITFKSPRKQAQVDAYLNHTPVIYDKTMLSKFLKSVKYPLYHLDFETMNEAIPPYDNTKPYEQLPFQYSLHIEMSQGGTCIHKEYLGAKLDCIRELAEQLVNDIPMNVCSIAYHSSTEKGIIRMLAKKYPDLSEHLLNIADHMIDLLDPFKKGYFYHEKQGNSNSIKYVMPALCPEMELAYKKLPVVHNGGEALTMFPKLVKMTGEEYQRVRQGMLDYCCLDTLSMVKVLNALFNFYQKL